MKSSKASFANFFHMITNLFLENSSTDSSIFIFVWIFTFLLKQILSYNWIVVVVCASLICLLIIFLYVFVCVFVFVFLFSLNIYTINLFKYLIWTQQLKITKYKYHKIVLFEQI